jgi:hypothetical protein
MSITKICPVCQKEFTSKGHYPKCCSLKCGYIFREKNTPPLPVEDRFWPKVKMGAIDECWEWQGQINKAGYGRFRIGKSMPQAHRVSYELAIGPIPEGMKVCHKCDNPKCCNWHHFFLGTQADNVADMITKGRARFGLGPFKSTYGRILTADQVHQLKALYKTGKYKPRGLAVLYSVSESTVRDIIKGRLWKHIT